MKRKFVLAALQEIARIVAETLELRDVVARVAEAASSVLPLDHLAIVRLGGAGEIVLYSHTDDLPTPPEPVSIAEISPGLRPQMDRVLRLDDVRAVLDPAFEVDRSIQQRGTRALLAAPLKRGDQTVGFATAESPNPGAFTAKHEPVFQSVADLLGLALEHERLWNLDAVRRGRLEAVDALLPVIAHTLDVADIFQQVSSVAKPVLPHDHLLLLSLSADETQIQLTAYSGDLERPLPPSAPVENYRRFPVGHEFHLVRDTKGRGQGGAPRDPVAKALGTRSFLRIPIYLEGVPESTLNFLSRSPDQYSEEDVPVARRVADHVSLALSHRRLAEEERRAALLEERVESLTEQLETTLGVRRVVGRSKRWKAVLAQVAKVAPTETTVLLTGESGTGKEVLARMIHRGSPRADGPFVAINCAALPETLLESELFGHEKGAFTGATATHLGRVEQASGGVLFLDEIGEMSPSVQAKLLRVLEQREFMRVGGARPIQADVRIVTATNRDLKSALARGHFREDLYYRLRVFEIVAPPLRERKDDILPLVEAFLEEIGRSVGRPAGSISQQVHDALLAYAWPGNARELRNVLERATILCDGGLITLEHLPPEVAPKGAAAPRTEATDPAAGATLESAEREMIAAALKRAGGNRSEAARILGITRPTLYYKIRKHGLE